jgi:hypothetical protein
MIDQLKTIGIEKGKPFQPDEKTKEILKAAAQEAHAWLGMCYEELFTSGTYFEGRHWAVPALADLLKGLATNFTDADSYLVDSRGLAYSLAFFSAKHLGAGQFYLMAIKNKAGRNFEGNKTYKLTVPPNAPVNQYWSATVYDRETHALIRDQKWSSRSSQTAGLQKNADGSVDIYFGSQAPKGKESNWVATAGRGFEVLSASMDQRSRCSIRAGSYLTSRKSNETKTSYLRVMRRELRRYNFS